MGEEVDMGCKRSRDELIMGGDLLVEVLIRLPVKVLFRYKVVSKQWYSMISEPSFARRYVARASLSPQWILISCFARQPIVEQFFMKNLPQCDCSLGIDCLDLLTVPMITRAYELRNLLVGVSDGLLLFGPALENGRLYSYVIYNPLTGQEITLPPHQNFSRFVIFTGFLTQIKDNVLESYRVLRIHTDYKCDHRTFSYEVYFSEIREWVHYTTYLNQNIYFGRWDNCVVIDKILHWIVKGHVMTFDLYNKPDSIRLISLPVDSIAAREEEERFEYILFDEQGHLRYLELFSTAPSDKFSLSLWELIDYDSGVWCLRNTAIFDNFPSSCDEDDDDDDRSISMRPLCFHPFGRPNILYMIYQDGPSRCIMSYDINARELKTLDETKETLDKTILEDSSKNGLSEIYDLSKTGLFQIPCFFPFFLFVVPPWPVSVNS